MILGAFLLNDALFWKPDLTYSPDLAYQIYYSTCASLNSTI